MSASADALRDGQLAANWVDVFADTISAELLPSSWPQVVVIDSMSMRVLSGPRRGQAFHVIAAVGRKRAVRGRWPERLMVCHLAASPTKTAAAFEAFCHSLDGRPEVVVTDPQRGATWLQSEVAPSSSAPLLVADRTSIGG